MVIGWVSECMRVIVHVRLHPHHVQVGEGATLCDMADSACAPLLLARASELQRGNRECMPQYLGHV